MPIFRQVKDEKERILIIRAFVDEVYFYSDNSGYFYVYDFNGVNIGHASQKNSQGKDLSGHQDKTGKFAIRQAIETAKKGGGFFEYYWKKPGEKGEWKKRGYIEPILETNYFIGSGTYLPENHDAGKK